MENYLKIAIDKDKLEEYFITYTQKPYILNNNGKDFYQFGTDKPTPKTLGSLFIEFINLDFNNKDAFKDFVMKYLFIPLLQKLFSNSLPRSIFYEKKYYIEPSDIQLFTVILSTEEIKEYYNRIYKEYFNDLKSIQKEYIAISSLNHKDYALETLNSTITLCNRDENYYSLINGLCLSIENLKINFDTEYTFNNRRLAGLIPFYFSSSKFEDILIIVLKELLTYKNSFRIQKCQNCGKYFIPKTAHPTLFCDEIYQNNSTCKQIGSELRHQKTLEKDSILQEYRKRYQNLASESSKSDNPIIKQMYEDYKKEGLIIRKNYMNNKITENEFREWIKKSYIEKQ